MGIIFIIILKYIEENKYMAFCSNCGERIEEGANFCNKCGKPVNENNSSRKVTYEGEIHKCPNCGEILNSFVSNCPTCGYELRSVNTSNTVKQFVLKLEQIEANRDNIDVDLRRKDPNALTKTDEQKVNLIRSFSIPNTKEDILEFLILASSNINTKSWLDNDRSTAAQEAESNAWIAKFEQAYQKADYLFGK